MRAAIYARVSTERQYELVTGAGTYDLAVPKKDGELVRHAFGGGAGLR